MGFTRFLSHVSFIWKIICFTFGLRIIPLALHVNVHGFNSLLLRKFSKFKPDHAHM